jgi:lipoprotein-releasing system permease protein
MLSLLGIVIGVFSLLVVSSVMNGFDADMRSRVIGSKAEIKIHKSDYSPIRNYNEIINKSEQISSVIGTAPVCENELMIQNENELASTICYGINLEQQKKVTQILDKIVVGEPSIEALENNGIIIGLDLSMTLNVTVGEYVQLTSPIGTEPTPFGLLPKSKKLKVVLLGEEFLVEDWSVFEANLFNAIKMEKIIMFFVLALMIIIASFNMTGNFIKLVTEKKMEIGVLKALGASEKDIIRIFVNVGITIGMLGTFIGLILALIVLLAQQNWHFIQIPVPGFPLHWLPVEIRILDFVIVPMVAIVISFLTTLHPSKRTVKIDPIKIIRK